MRGEGRGYLVHGHDEDAVVRATKRDGRVRKPRAEPRRDDDGEDRGEAGRRFVELRLQLAKAGRGLPVDLLARVAAAMGPNSAKAEGIGYQPATRGRLGEGSQRGKRAIADSERRRVGRDLGSERYGPFALGEAEPIAGTQAQGPDRIGAAGWDADGQAHEDAFPP